MKAYEVMLLLDSRLEDDAREGVVERVRKVIATDGGEVDKVESWGKRRLAYEIDGVSEGDYVLIDFHTNPLSIAEIDRVLHITDPVLRYMIIRREDRE